MQWCGALREQKRSEDGRTWRPILYIFVSSFASPGRPRYSSKGPLACAGKNSCLIVLSSRRVSPCSALQEWCELSIRETSNKFPAGERRNNFQSVASKASSAHLAYHRDLLMLLRLGMEIKEYDLVLDLCKFRRSCLSVGM